MKRPHLHRFIGASRALAPLTEEIAGLGAGDLPSTPDPRASLPPAAAVSGLLAATLVVLTAATHVGAGYALSDVFVLSVGFGLSAVAMLRIPWRRLDARYLAAIPFVHLLYVAALDTLTGGSHSPYVVLYAPVLALAGWYLTPTATLFVVAVAAATEAWRSILEPAARLDTLTIVLPVAGLLAIVASFSARRLAHTFVSLRRDQVRTAAAMHAIDGLAELAAHEEVGLHLADLASTVFEADARVIPLPLGVEGSSGLDDVGLDRRMAVLLIPLGVPTGDPIGLLQVWRSEEFSPTERRLAAILGRAAALALRPGVAALPAG